MNKFYPALALALVLPATALASAKKQRTGKLDPAFGKMPVAFEPREQPGEFQARGVGYAFRMSATAAQLHLRNRSGASSELCLELTGANEAATGHGIDKLPGTVNYFIGSDPQQWRRGISTFARVKYEAVYPGIDLVFYGHGGQLEYDFIVAPGTDPDVIQWQIRGAGNVQVNGQGDLVISLVGGEVLQRKPVTYQEDESGRRRQIDSSFMVEATKVRFAIGPYDKTKPLIIDPVLVYSTFLGGTGQDFATDLVVDSTGDAYLVGHTKSSDFPSSGTAYQKTRTPNSLSSTGDAFITKFFADGSGIAFSTYLGSDGDDFAYGVAVDAGKNVYVCGFTDGSNFPRVNSIQPTGAIFAAKLSADGSQLLYSTQLGGSDSVHSGGESIMVDASENIYLTGGVGDSDSTNATHFPTTPGAYQTTHAGGNFDVFVCKINPAAATPAAPEAALVYSTLIGGSEQEHAEQLTIDAAGNAYVVGQTHSTDFPTTPGAFERTSKASGSSGSDAFAVKLNPSGTALVYSTFLAGSQSDGAATVKLDEVGNAIVGGGTSSTDYPTSPQAFQSVLFGGSDAFVTKLNATGSAVIFSTYLGGSGQESIIDLVVDSTGRVCISGWTESDDFVTVNAFQPNFGGGISDGLGLEPCDAFVARMSADGTALDYSTYVGGSGNEGRARFAFNGASALGYAPIIGSVGVDEDFNLFATGVTSSPDFPTTSGAYQTAFAGNNDVYLLKFEDPDLDFNDNFEARQTLGGSSVKAIGANLGATKQPGEPAHAGETGGASVWWSWQAPVDGAVTISTSGSNFDTVLAVYSGETVAGLTEITSNNNDPAGAATTSRVQFTAVAGTVYQVAVDGTGGTAGTIRLQLALAPLNDHFTGATVLAGTTATATGFNVQATKEAGEPSHAANPGGASVWWRWTSPPDVRGFVTISTENSNFDTVLAVYTGTDVSTLTQVAANDDANGRTSEVSFNVTAATTYHIAVDGFNGGTGNINLHLDDIVLPPLPVVTVSATDGDAAEAGQNIGRFTFSRTGSTSSALTVDIDLGGTAVANSDFNLDPPERFSVTFPAGSESTTLKVTPLDDAIFEGTETVTVDLDTHSHYQVGSPSQGTVTITDEDNGDDVIQLDAQNYSASEGDGFAQVKLVRDGPKVGSKTASVRIKTSEISSAKEGLDYTTVDQIVNFAAGETTKTVKIAILKDSVAEPDEVFLVRLSSPSSGATLGSKEAALVTIVNSGGAANAGTFKFNKPSYSVAETAPAVTITVNRSGGQNGAVTVHYATKDGSATAGADYVATTGTLTFANGQSAASFDVPITNDTIREVDETFVVRLSAPTGGAKLGDALKATVTITSEDSPNGVLQFSSARRRVNESAGLMQVTVNRTGGTNGAVSAGYVTRNSTAAAGVEFTDTTGTLNLAHGQASGSFFVPILDDTSQEENKAFLVKLRSPTGGATLGRRRVQAVTIVDDDNPHGTFEFTAPNYDVGESAGSTTVTIARRGGSAGTATVLCETSNGSAGTADYVISKARLTFSDGETSKTFEVRIREDSLAEAEETIKLTLTAPTGTAGLAAQRTATVTILDNE